MTPSEESSLPKSYHLQWNNHSANLQSLLQYHYVEKKFVDVTLHCPDGHLNAHKIVLSSCSSYFESVLALNPNKHASIILRDIPVQTLKLIVAYMYLGSVDIPVTELPSLLVIANELRVKGLTQDAIDDDKNSAHDSSLSTPASSPKTDENEQAMDPESQEPLAIMKVKNTSEYAELSLESVRENNFDLTKRADENCIVENMMSNISKSEMKNENTDSREKQQRVDETFQFDFSEERNYYSPDLFCSICNRSFLNKQNMKRHMQTHSGVKPHQCNFCSLSFLRLSHLQRHHRTHTGERPFSCDECGKHFSRSDKLKQHFSQHHSGIVIPKQPKQRGRPRKIPVTVPINVTIQGNPKLSMENIDSVAAIPSFQTLQQIYSLSVLQ